MASLVLTIKGSPVAGLKVDSSLDHQAVQDICNHLHALASGNEKGTIYAQSGSADPVAASGTITLATVLATHTVTIGGVTFTASSTPAGEAQFEIDGTDTADAAALAAAINAHSTLSQVVSATSAAAVVTVSALTRGVAGNFIALTQTGGTMTLSAAALANGTGGATNSASTYAFGQ